VSGDSFGLKIGLEGDKIFRQSLADINQSFKVLGSEMQLVTSQFDKNDRSAQALTSRNTVLNKEIDTQKEKITTLKAALDNAASSFGDTDRRTQNWQVQLNKAEAELAGMERELRNNNATLLSHSEKYAYLGKEIEVATREYVKIRNEYGANSAEAKALEARLSELAGEHKAAGQAADEEDKQLAEVTKSLGLYTRGTADAAIETEKAGGKFAKVVDVLKDVGKVIAGVVTGVTGAAASVGVGMFKMAESAAAMGKEINLTSQKLGLSREGFQEWSYILKKSGTSIDIMGTGMKTLQKTMGGLTEDGDNASKVFAAIGIRFDEIKGKTPEEALNMTVRALQDMPAGAERTAAALKLFGKGAMEMQPLLNKTSADTDELRQRAHDLGLIMSGEQVDAAGKFNSAMGKARDTVAGMKMQLSNALLPAFADGISAFMDFAQGAEGGEEKMKSAVDNMVQAITVTIPEMVEKGSEMISALITGVSQALPGIVGAISDALPLIIGVITEMVPKLASCVMSAVPIVVSALLSTLPMLTGAAVQIILALVTGLSDMLPELIPVAVEAVKSIVEGLTQNLPLLLDAALALVLALTKGVLAALPELVRALPEIIIAIVDFVIGSIPQIIDAGIKLLVSLVDALPEIIQAIIEAIPKIIDGIIVAVIEAIPLVVDAGITLLISLVQALPQIINTVVKAIPQIVSGLINAIIGNMDKIILAGVQLFAALVQNTPKIVVEVVKAVPKIIFEIVKAIIGFVPKLAEAGLNLIKGLWSGISDASAWLWSKIKGFLGGILDNIKGFFGIHSPSTVFAGLGKNMAEGLGLGFEDEMDDVSKAMREAIPTSLDAPELSFNTDIHAALNGAGAVVSLADIGLKLDGISGILIQMLPVLLEALDIKVVLDDGTLVGRLTPEIDRALALLRRRNLAH